MHTARSGPAGRAARPLSAAPPLSNQRFAAPPPSPRVAIKAASSRRPPPGQQQHSGKQQQQQQHLRRPGQQDTVQAAAAERPAGGERGAGGGGAGGGGAGVAAVACVAAAVAAVPAVLPATASASSVLAALVPHSLQQHQAWQTVCWGCTAAGAASLLATIVCTSRFLVSYYPSLEREAEQHRWRLPWVAVTLFDPLLQPLRRRFFGQTEEGDLDYAAVALLAVVCSVLECAVGKDGLLLPFIPDFGLRDALQYLIIFQHGFLLPLWVMVVLRWGRVI